MLTLDRGTHTQSGFVTINAIRLKKFGLQKAEAGQKF